ncbi:unnamed protein product [Cyprideis torosa]|uniref:Uncharacterized protein n=1 Tax=Cyprideis torosa TaxID=163714 RepID=A0A7R8WRE8_9CRUS|nr:unnamed protein product [Cyprideis torosa]CAG0903610.1 unnamed protein product [Cyprideis torosa]
MWRGVCLMWMWKSVFLNSLFPALGGCGEESALCGCGKVTDANEGLSRTVRHFQFTEWPEQGVPKQGEGFIDFIGQVHKTKDQFGHEGPITVHCSAGVGRTGVFITLSIVLERMQYEMVVDMFQTVRTLRTQRPGMVQTEDQYQFCYKAALEYLNSFDHYGS